MATNHRQVVCVPSSSKQEFVSLSGEPASQCKTSFDRLIVLPSSYYSSMMLPIKTIRHLECGYILKAKSQQNSDENKEWGINYMALKTLQQKCRVSLSWSSGLGERLTQVVGPISLSLHDEQTN